MNGKIQDEYDHSAREAVLHKKDIKTAAECEGTVDDDEQRQNKRGGVDPPDEDQKDEEQTAAETAEKDQKDVSVRKTNIEQKAFTEFQMIFIDGGRRKKTHPEDREKNAEQREKDQCFFSFQHF